MELNSTQRAAVDEPPKNITVSAAAGSGKTQVLGERVRRRITGDDPVDVNRLLIVTFTRAAAAEMRSRISQLLTKDIAAETDPARRGALERQLSLLGGADICTIDSFCYRLLKQNFFRVPGLAPDFSVSSEASMKDITAEALRTAAEMFSSALEESRGGELTAHYRNRAEELRRFFPEEELPRLLEGYALLSENYGSAKRTNDFMTDENGGDDYVDFIRRIKRTLDSTADPEKWLADRAADYDPAVPFDETALGRYGGEWAAGFLADLCRKLETELQSGLNLKNTDVFTKTLENIRSIPAPRNYSEAAEIFRRPVPVEGNVQAKDTKAGPGDPGAARVMESVRGLWKKAQEYYETETENIEIFRARFRPAALALLGMTRLTLALERKRMLEKKRLSFSVCVGLALELLTEDGGPSETAMELRDYYDEIYVDEAQDIDPRQLAIFEAISKGNLFMVGDVKQSIYGFRQAEPELFNDRCRQGGNSRLITMNTNYRSCETVIGAVNQVFARVMSESVMGVDYQRDHRLEHGENWLPKPSRAEFLAVVDEEKSARRYKAELEAQALASRLVELVESGRQVYDKKNTRLRPIECRDIIVLFRSNKDGVLLERVFGENGLPCYLDGGQGLYSREEITAVADVLRLVDDPRRDIPLAAVLRGLMFGFDENDLLKIRAVSGGMSFSRVFCVLSSEEDPRHEEYAARLGDAELLARCLNVGGLLKKWRSIAAFRPIGDVIQAILGDTGYYASVGALPMGAARRANLDLLCDLAEEYEAAGSRGLYSFINYIEMQELSGGESTEAKTLSDEMNVIRLMTIHKSKGLEAPVVALFKCPSPFWSPTEALKLSRDLGFSADYINEAAGYRYRSPLSPLIGLERRSRERAEEARLLYVAMTRPREMLICTGYYPNQAALERTLNFDRELTMSDAAFLTDSYAKMLGSAVTNERLWKMSEVAAGDVAGPRPSRLLASAPAFNENVLDTVSKLLGFTYRFAGSAGLPAKVSVSALKAMEQDDEFPAQELYASAPRALRAPAFAGERPVTGSELGTAYHAVMEALDFGAPVTPQIDLLEKQGIISAAVRKLIRDEKISALLNSPLGLRMRTAGRIWREAPFMMALPAAELGLAEDTGETVAVQGIIDCYFEDGDGITLVDYKTDAYDDPIEIVKKYKKQLLYYEKAIKMKFSDKKIQKYLYLFHKGDIIEV